MYQPHHVYLLDDRTLLPATVALMPFVLLCMSGVFVAMYSCFPTPRASLLMVVFMGLRAFCLVVVISFC